MSYARQANLVIQPTPITAASAVFTGRFLLLRAN